MNYKLKILCLFNPLARLTGALFFEETNRFVLGPYSGQQAEAVAAKIDGGSDNLALGIA